MTYLRPCMLFLLFSIFCVSTQLNAIENMPVAVSIKGNQAYYQGYLSHDGIEELKYKIIKAETKIEWLNITSGGGDVTLGMDLGRFIFNNKLNIRVEEYCMSSCANYVFTSANIKEIGELGLIGFHGGALNLSLSEKEIEAQLEHVPKAQKNFVRKQIIEQTETALTNHVRQQTEFFAFINVDPRITNYGQQEKYSKYEGVNWGWYYSVSEYIKFNIKNVKLIAPLWYFKSPNADVSLFEISDVKLEKL